MNILKEVNKWTDLNQEEKDLLFKRILEPGVEWWLGMVAENIGMALQAINNNDSWNIINTRSKDSIMCLRCSYIVLLEALKVLEEDFPPHEEILKDLNV